jgi:hypothetical protein
MGVHNVAKGNAQGLLSLAKYSRLPIDRIDYRPEADATVIGSMDRGILYFMAFWSGPSISAFRTLTEVVARLDKSGALKFVVVDVDGSPTLYEVPELRGKIHGAGEAAWIRKGKIIATSGLGLNLASYEPNTVSLLSLD